MKWATRPGIHVDRAACAWLIRRFIDPDADFVFPDDPAAVPAGATPFDMRGAALGHHQGRCSFETALEAFGLTTDPALEEIGHIVHEADLADESYDTPTAPGLDVLIRGLTLTSGSDHDTLTGWLFDGLYEHSRRRSATAYTTVSKDRTTSRPVSVTSQPLRWRALSESADWGHDAQHRLAADILQREVHQVSHRVHGDGMGFGREKLPAQGHQ